LGRSA
jgi:hypothetical protein